MAKRQSVTKVEVAIRKKVEQELTAKIVRNANSLDPKGQVAKFIDQRKSLIYGLSRGYYAGTLETIGRFTRTGVKVNTATLRDPRKLQSVEREWNVDVGFKDSPIPRVERSVPLQSGRTSHTPWRGLPLKYIAISGPRSKQPGVMRDPYGKWQGLPRSSRFWVKTKKLQEAYGAWLAGYEPRNPILHSFGSESKKVLISKIEDLTSPNRKRKRIWQTRLRLSFPSLGYPGLDKIIRESFVSTRPRLYRVYVRDGLGQLDKGEVSPDRLAYPEYSRPIIARFAAAMGKRQRAALVKLLKTF